MMVLASVYLSVSSSLPSTANIKPVEVWLLFNLAYPMTVILLNVLLQVTVSNTESLITFFIFSPLRTGSFYHGSEKHKISEENHETIFYYSIKCLNVSL